jgi:hypothetical protein
MMKHMITVVLFALFPSVGISAGITAGDVREAVIDAFRASDDIRCTTMPGRMVIWTHAGEHIVQVPAGKAPNVEYREERKMLPSDGAWVVEIIGPFDKTLSQHEWGSRSEPWKEIWKIDKWNIYLLQAERFIPVDGTAVGYGLRLTCGERWDTAVVKTFQELDIDPATRPVPVRTEGDLRLEKLQLLFNRDQWDSFSVRYKKYYRKKQQVWLEHPRQVVLLNKTDQAGSLAAQNDNIMRDLQQNVFRKSFRLVRDWPAYRLPEYLVAVRKLDGSWVLVAEIGEYYLIEDQGFPMIIKRDHK